MASLKSSAPKLPSVFPFKTAFYFKKDSKRVYVCGMNPDQKAQFAKGNRPTLTDDQQQVFLKMLALDEAKSPSNPNRPSMMIATLAELYLDDRKGVVSATKHKFYTVSLNSFCAFCGALPLTDITPALVRRWVAANTSWKSTSTVRSNVKVVLQMCNWAIDERMIAAPSPLAALGKALDTEAPDAIRDYCIYDAERETMLVNSSEDFKTIILALLETGRRPDEIANVKKSEVVRTGDGLQWRIATHKNAKKTGKPETIYLTPDMQALTLKALSDESNKTPFLFVNSKGKAWTTASIGDKWDATKKAAKLKNESTPYSCRHTFITKAIYNGVPLAVIAKLVGNSIEVLARHYAHLEQQHQEVYVKAITQATKANENYRSEAMTPATTGKAAI